MKWQKVALIGVGLLGGSLGLAIRERRLAARVEGYVRRQASIAECETAGAVDCASLDLEAVVAGADLIVFCTPLARMRELALKLLPALEPGALVTDVGSVKAAVVSELEPLIAGTGATFVGSHPMAGAEQMGVSAARCDLFEKAVCVVTPTGQTPPAALEQIEQFWREVGGIPIRMTPQFHDELVCRASHLPHVIAAQLANHVLNPDFPPEQARLCSNGFRDTTRVASGSPEMWRDIALANRENLSLALSVLVRDIEKLRSALERGDGEAIMEFFETAKKRRDQWRETSTSGPHAYE